VIRSFAGRLPLWLLAAVLAILGLVPTGHLLTGGGSISWWGGAARLWLIWLVLIAVVTVGLSRALPSLVDRALAGGRRLLLAPTRPLFMLDAAAAATALALYFGGRLFGADGSTSDEFAQQWQAHLLTMGRLWARSETYPEFFSTTMTLDIDGRWFGQFPIGGPAILAMGLAVGIPSMVNPLLTGLCAAMLYRFASAITDDATARGATLLFVLSPFVLFMGGSQMNHTATLAAVLVALAALPAWAGASPQSRTMRSAMVVGGALGVAATIRPYDAALVALAIGVFQLAIIFTVAAERRARALSLVAQCAAGALPVTLLLWANWRTVGDPLSFAYDVLNGAEHRPGFHVGPNGYPHTVGRGLALMSTYLWKLDFGLLGWPLPILLFVVAVLVLRRGASRWDLLLVALTCSIIGGYVAYWGDGHFVGPRFLFLLVPAVAIWVAQFSGTLASRLARPTLRRAALLVAPLLTLIAWSLPANRAHPYGVWTLSRSYETRVPPARLVLDGVRDIGAPRTLVFVEDGWHARLAARMRAAGMPPFVAEQFAFSVDGCMLQHALDSLDRAQVPVAARAVALRAAASRDAEAATVAGMSPLDQLALVPGRRLTPDCQSELARSRSGGFTLAQLLPYLQLDADGAIAGDVVFARHLGARNELLRKRFGDRRWYVARVEAAGSGHRVVVEPYEVAGATAAMVPPAR
jgi:hypothetical protein